MERDKRGMGRSLKITFLVLGVIVCIFLLYFLLTAAFSKKTNVVSIPINNPITPIVERNTLTNGTFNREEVVREGIDEFNETYINYILVSLGVNNLHRSALSFGNPVIAIDVGELWNSEVIGGALNTKKGSRDSVDIIIRMSKEEAVNSLMADNMASFMKASVISGNTKLDMLASKPILYSKGYLDLYNRLTS